MILRRFKPKRELLEDALKHIYDCEYRKIEATIESLEGVLRLRAKRILKLIEEMEHRGLVVVSGKGLKLTSKGRAWAIQVIRAHRLWESYLSNEVGVPLEKLHKQAEKKEHSLTVSQIDELERKLGYPVRDPHGDPIPTVDHQINEALKGTSLLDWPKEKLGMIVHIEDEPPSILTQIIIEGFALDTVLKVKDKDERGLRIWTLTNECWLAPIVAANINVDEAPRWFNEAKVESLTTLEPGEEATILAVRSQGLNRRRLLDLGLVAGTTIKVSMTSALQDPKAYEVRGSMIVLRKEQAEQVLIQKTNSGNQ